MKGISPVTRVHSSSSVWSRIGGLTAVLILSAGWLQASAQQAMVLPSGERSQTDKSGAPPASDAKSQDSMSRGAEAVTQQSTAEGLTASGAVSQNQRTASTHSADTSPAKMTLIPGQAFSVGTKAEDLVPTDDVELAKKQAVAFPDSPEASFILAVALTRTSRVEEALKEVRHARRLADAKGGPEYFDKMIATYEHMLTYCPDDNRIRYGLAWAYYMKAYLVQQHQRKLAQLSQLGQHPQMSPWETAASSAASAKHNGPAASADSGAGVKAGSPGALSVKSTVSSPPVNQYYQAAITKLDELLKRDPKDIWAKVYRAQVKAEFSGNLGEAMITWKSCRDEAPDNPAPYFFLGEGYLKQGNLQECLANVSRAIALRALGK